MCLYMFASMVLLNVVLFSCHVVFLVRGFKSIEENEK
jgi:hypothetical protein